MTESAQRKVQELAEQERQVARRIDMSGYRLPLIGGAAGIVVSWFLPYTGPITGLDLALFSQRSVDYGIATPERVFVWLCALGPVVLNLLGYFRQSTRTAQVAWIFSGISMFFSIFAIWMRQTRDQGAGPGPGLIIAAISVLFVVYGLYNVVTMLSDEQENLRDQRREEVYVDPVAQEQLNVLKSKASFATDERGPIDDRRARNAERRVRGQQPLSVSEADAAPEGNLTEEPDTGKTEN